MITIQYISFVLTLGLMAITSLSAAASSDRRNSQISQNQNAVDTTKNPSAPPVDDSYMMINKEPMKNYDSSAFTSPNTEKMTVVEVINANPSLTTLTAALKASDLNQKLQNGGPYTILAPNDAAFAKLSPNTLADLLKPENKSKLASILNYHVLPGKVKAANIKASKIKAIDGKTMEAKISESGDLTLNNAKVVKSDIMGTNGVIHIIDTVLLP